MFLRRLGTWIVVQSCNQKSAFHSCQTPHFRNIPQGQQTIFCPAYGICIVYLVNGCFRDNRRNSRMNSLLLHTLVNLHGQTQPRRRRAQPFHSQESLRGFWTFDGFRSRCGFADKAMGFCFARFTAAIAPLVVDRTVRGHRNGGQSRSFVWHGARPGLVICDVVRHGPHWDLCLAIRL